VGWISVPSGNPRETAHAHNAVSIEIVSYTKARNESRTFIYPSYISVVFVAIHSSETQYVPNCREESIPLRSPVYCFAISR
jgi:hypothetical protein